MERAVDSCEKRDGKCYCPVCGTEMDKHEDGHNISPGTTSTHIAFSYVCTCPKCEEKCECEGAAPKPKLEPPKKKIRPGF